MNRFGAETNRLKLSLKLYQESELQVGYQQLVGEAFKLASPILIGDMPHSLFCSVVTPSLSGSVHSAKELFGSDVRSSHPIVEDWLNL